MMLSNFIQIAAILGLSVIGSNANEVRKCLNAGKQG
jgi:hypothetical protein